MIRHCFEVWPGVRALILWHFMHINFAEKLSTPWAVWLTRNMHLSKQWKQCQNRIYALHFPDEYTICKKIGNDNDNLKNICSTNLFHNLSCNVNIFLSVRSNLIMTLVRHKNPGSTAECMVRHKMPYPPCISWHCHNQTTPTPFLNCFSNFIQTFCFKEPMHKSKPLSLTWRGYYLSHTNFKLLSLTPH